MDLADLDFAEGGPQLKLDLIGDLAVKGGIAGNVGGEFKDMGPMTFLSLSLLRELEKAKASSNASTAQPAS